MAILNTNPIITVTAGETLSARDYVFIAHATAPHTYVDGIVAGRAYKTDKAIRHKSINASLIGFALHAATAGQNVQIQTAGRMSGFAGLVAGASYQPSGTSGQIERLENHRAALQNPIARAISATELEIVSQQWEVRGKGYVTGQIVTRYDLDYKTVTCSTSSYGLTVARTWLAASSSSIKGYWGGGSTGSVSNVVDSINFSVETSLDSGDLTVARESLAGAASSLKSYNLGGYNGSSTVNTIDANVHAVEGNFADVGDLTVAERYVASASSAVKCYTKIGTALNTIAFATEGNAVSSPNIFIGSNENAMSSSATKAYVYGGIAGSIISTIQALSFATETSSTLTSVLSSARDALCASSSSVAGFVYGGWNGSSNVNSIDALSFSSEISTLATVSSSTHAIDAAASS